MILMVYHPNTVQKTGCITAGRHDAEPRTGMKEMAVEARW